MKIFDYTPIRFGVGAAVIGSIIITAVDDGNLKLPKGMGQAVEFLFSAMSSTSGPTDNLYVTSTISGPDFKITPPHRGAPVRYIIKST